MQQPMGDEEDQIIVKCREVSPEIMGLLHQLHAQSYMLTGYIDEVIRKVPPSEIFYIETVNGRTFLYGEHNVYEAKQKLYELEENLGTSDFLRVSKSVLLNLRKIKTLVPALSGRLEAILKNDEKVIISRQYVGELKQRLDI